MSQGIRTALLTRARYHANKSHTKHWYIIFQTFIHLHQRIQIKHSTNYTSNTWTGSILDSIKIIHWVGRDTRAYHIETIPWSLDGHDEQEMWTEGIRTTDYAICVWCKQFCRLLTIHNKGTKADSIPAWLSMMTNFLLWTIDSQQYHLHLAWLEKPHLSRIFQGATK